jgi:hypothetical protein
MRACVHACVCVCVCVLDRWGGGGSCKCVRACVRVSDSCAINLLYIFSILNRGKKFQENALLALSVSLGW